MTKRCHAAYVCLCNVVFNYPRRLVTYLFYSRLSCWFLILLFVLALLPIARPTSTMAAPQLWLPMPIGEPWKIIQGYGCGTHNAYDFYALDLVRANGPIYGAPVRASAEGTVFGWFGSSGTLIIKHTNSFYTQYTHLATVTKTGRGQFIAQGEVIGTVGDRGSPGNPHLHFMAFTAHGPYASGRQTMPLSFADGYSLPDIGGCNQHYGKILTAQAPADLPPPEINFSSDAEPERWYNEDKRIDFTIEGPVTGFSQAWSEELLGDEPMYEFASEGYVQTEWADEGYHTLYVRAYSPNGDQVLATYGPVGYDITPPQAPDSIAPITILANRATDIRWNEGTDEGSGIAGYQVYIGKDADGESDWYTEEAEVEAPPLAPGTYHLRVRPKDNARNAGEWATIGRIAVQGELSEATQTPTALPPTATAEPEETPVPTNTAPPPTATAEPEETPASTSTAPPATATPSPKATQPAEETPTPRATQPPKGTPSPTATRPPKGTPSPIGSPPAGTPQPSPTAVPPGKAGTL